MSSAPACPCPAGVKLDPFNPELKLALQQANQAVLKVGRARSALSICRAQHPPQSLFGAVLPAVVRQGWPWGHRACLWHVC